MKYLTLLALLAFLAAPLVSAGCKSEEPASPAEEKTLGERIDEGMEEAEKMGEEAEKKAEEMGEEAEKKAEEIEEEMEGE